MQKSRLAHGDGQVARHIKVEIRQQIRWGNCARCGCWWRRCYRSVVTCNQERAKIKRVSESNKEREGERVKCVCECEIAVANIAAYKNLCQMEIYFHFHFHCITVKRYSMPHSRRACECVCVCGARKTLVLAAKTVKSNKILIKIQQEQQQQQTHRGKNLQQTIIFPFFLWHFVCLPFFFPPTRMFFALVFPRFCIRCANRGS